MNKIAEPVVRVGRIQDWLEKPYGRLPVSCTVFVVEDTMEGPEGIESSWRFVSHALRSGAGCAIHLSKLRPRGDENGKGLTASGPVSFAKMYSVINETLRRGGVYKNGAVVLHLDYTHPDILEFIQAPREDLPWVKRCVNVDDYLMQTPRPVLDALLEGIKKGDIWLNKIRHHKYKRIYGNVCLEVYLPSRGTCLLQHINLGACTIENLPRAFERGMLELINLHAKTGVGETGEYLPPEQDRQVGLGILGLANFLAQNRISYSVLLDALYEKQGGIFTADYHLQRSKADAFVKSFKQGVDLAARLAEVHGFERAFCIAPTASCSYQNVDIRGFVTCPELAPPTGRQIDRDSGTFGVTEADYPPDVEIASQVGWDTYKRVADGIVRIYQETGLFHGYSFNSWSDVITYDDDFLKSWLYSPQTSLYYALQVMPDTQRKDHALAALDEDFRDVFQIPEEEVEACPINPQDDNSCSACAE